jgi:uncharacterized Zn finger protein (UPF0148 family)
LNLERTADTENLYRLSSEAAVPRISRDATGELICPVCGVTEVQEKCKVICRSEICRGRVVMNCSEF